MWREQTQRKSSNHNQVYQTGGGVISRERSFQAGASLPVGSEFFKQRERAQSRGLVFLVEHGSLDWLGSV
jgi:hypothetical protein